MAQSLAKAHKRWPTGIFAYWYPIKDPNEVAAYIRALEASGIKKILRLELTIRQPSTLPRLHGSGMIIVNPPFVLEAEMARVLPALAKLLSDENRGGYTISWVRGEA